MRRAVLLIALVPLLGACRRETARTAVSDTTQPRVDPATAPGVTALELWQLRPGVTLGDWHTARPDEPLLASDSGVAPSLGDWCAAVQKQTPAGSRVVRRTAFFYPPSPTDLALPDSAPDLARQCLLGLVWVAISETDSLKAVRLADSLRAQLGGSFGAEVHQPVSFFGSAFWSRTARFARDSTTVVTALGSTSYALRHDSTPPHWTVLAFALRPVAGVAVDTGAPLVAGPFTPGDTLSLDSAMTLAGIDTARANALRTAVLAADTPAVSHPPRDLIRPLTRWLDAAEELPPPQHAAALFAADLVLDRSLCTYGMCELADRTSRAPLEALGARFNASQLGASWVYTRSWLGEARALERDSPLGQRILLIQMNGGFDFSGTCTEGTEMFRRVIENGERYLARLPQSPIAADVHFLVGEAYRDIVALAHGAGDIYADSSQYGTEAGPAAAKAVEHYRAAMRAGPGSATARAAWRQAWKLKAGLVPREVRFYCVYD